MAPPKHIKANRLVVYILASGKRRLGKCVGTINDNTHTTDIKLTDGTTVTAKVYGAKPTTGVWRSP